MWASRQWRGSSVLDTLTPGRLGVISLNCLLYHIAQTITPRKLTLWVWIKYWHQVDIFISLSHIIRLSRTWVSKRLNESASQWQGHIMNDRTQNSLQLGRTCRGVWSTSRARTAGSRGQARVHRYSERLIKENIISRQWEFTDLMKYI